MTLAEEAAKQERERERFTTAAELLLQVMAGRAEQAAVIVTTNLPFSEWNTMFSNARLCKAMLARLTDPAHIIDTGKESYRIRGSLEEKKGGKGSRAERGMREGWPAQKGSCVVGDPSLRSAQGAARRARAGLRSSRGHRQRQDSAESPVFEGAK